MSAAPSNQPEHAYAFPNQPNVVEVGLFVHRRELAVLETAARRAGLTIGELMRRLICDFLHAAPTVVYLDPEGEADGAPFR
jgi:hypothetical protein